MQDAHARSQESRRAEEHRVGVVYTDYLISYLTC
jgi:hypothetical protein